MNFDAEGCWKIDSECRAARGERFGFDGSAVFADDRETDAEAEARASAGALGGIEGVEEALNGIGADADAVVLKRDGDASADTRKADLDAAGLADFANGLLGVGDEVEKNLDELVGVGDDAGKIGLRAEIDFDIISAKRVLVELERAIDDTVEIDGFFLGRSGAGKFEKVLNDARSATGLTMGDLELAFGGFGIRLTFAEQFRDAENRSEGIVKLVSDPGQHLAHGS